MGMTSLPEPVERLAAALGRLPGLGPRSAERLALHLVQSDASQVRSLAQCLLDARDTIAPCSVCGALTQSQPCALCADPGRDDTLICVVESALDVLRIHKAGVFHGRFHVLGGRLSPVSGVGPEDLRLDELEGRVRGGAVREVILALATDVEGDATCHYLARRLAGAGIKVSRIAHGLPAGSGLEFADELTLAHAIEGRREICG